jgi:hypothetical protein
VAKKQNTFEKRRREVDKKHKADEKRRRRREKKQRGDEPAVAADVRHQDVSQSDA